MTVIIKKGVICQELTAVNVVVWIMNGIPWHG